MNKREQIIEVLAKYYPNFANIEKVADDIIVLQDQEKVTDEEIETYARKIYKEHVYMSEYRSRKDAYVHGAKAMRDDKIK
jgi:ABC-type uncharacterized transport system ATPase subunit